MQPEQDTARLDPAVLRAQVRAAFERNGIAVASWAKANNLSPALVHRVLNSVKTPVRGASHRAAVLLGLKDGDASLDAKNYDPRRAA